MSPSQRPAATLQINLPDPLGSFVFSLVVFFGGEDAELERNKPENQTLQLVLKVTFNAISIFVSPVCLDTHLSSVRKAILSFSLVPVIKKTY